MQPPMSCIDWLAPPRRSAPPFRPIAGPVSAEALAKSFTRARVDRIDELLDALASLGQAREVADDLFIPPTIAR
jgi:hypothetical protein